MINFHWNNIYAYIFFALFYTLHQLIEIILSLKRFLDSHADSWQLLWDSLSLWHVALISSGGWHPYRLRQNDPDVITSDLVKCTSTSYFSRSRLLVFPFMKMEYTKGITVTFLSLWYERRKDLRGLQEKILGELYKWKIIQPIIF